ncbi:hypothetical protein [Snodgrassella communis]|uniref:hypothetical protein n=1 Tax=Snodgrassella communis TaxID=2946699 RepID=UPI001EF71BF7|nr:hypothetical protein [Snodgrassella communis]
MNLLFLIGMNLGLTGCMEAAIDFWNGPGFSSAARDKASHECFEELRTLPRPKNKDTGSKEMQEWLIKVYYPASIECMKRKGF